MKIVQVSDYFVTKDLTEFYSTIESARYDHAFETILEAPDYVFPGWIYDSSRPSPGCFIKPAVPDGWAYDDESGTFYNLNPVVETRLPTKTELHYDHLNLNFSLAMLDSGLSRAIDLLGQMKGANQNGSNLRVLQLEGS